MHLIGDNKGKEIKVKSVEKLVMGKDDVLFVTISGEHNPKMIGYLHEELKALLGHERFMVITDTIKLQVVSGEKIEEAKTVMKLLKGNEEGKKDD